MNICLVSPPTVTDFEDPEVAESEAVRLISEHAPIGILSLASVLERRGRKPAVVDLNRLYYDYLRAEAFGHVDFCAYAAGAIDIDCADVLGLSTICSSYPLTLRMAHAFKKRRPDITIVLGGPQASVVDVATMRNFDQIDFVVRGEAEETFPALLDAIESNLTLAGLPGITYRDGGEVHRNPNAPVIADLDSLPLPAFHLHPDIAGCRYIPLELGRGCPFACTFCSTNDFFRRNFRLKSPSRLIEDMSGLKAAYGINTFDLIHDMFTVDRKRVVAFCQALLDSGEQFYWNCSARTDCVDPELIQLMAEAGCRAMFFGIETGSPRLQKIIKKDLDLEESRRMIACNDRHGITTAVSLIYGFPDEEMNDVRQTVGFFVDSLSHDYAAPQLHILAPLAETPLHELYRNELVLDDVLSDMSHQGWRQDPADREMIAAHRDVFPNFYGLPAPGLDREYLKEARDFLLKGMTWFRWLLVALHRDRGDLLEVFDAWREWRALDNPVPMDGAELSKYYGHRRFTGDFLRFLRERYVPALARHRRVIAAIADFETALSSGLPTDAPPESESDSSSPMPADSAPALAPGVKLIPLALDYNRLIRCLKRQGHLNRVPGKAVTVAARLVTDQGGQKRGEVLQLSPLSAELLTLCDGSRSVNDIVSIFKGERGSVAGVAGDKACVFGLELLRAQKLIVPLAKPAGTPVLAGESPAA